MGTFRAKLITIVASAAFAFVVLLVSSTMVGSRIDTELAKIEQRHLPRLELGPRLEAHFERLGRAFQDAVASHDLDALDRTREIEDAFLEQLAGAKDVVDAAESASLRVAMESYYAAAHDVSRRLIAEETGERIVESMTEMQTKRARVKELLELTTSVDHREITNAFFEANRAHATARRVQLLVSVGALGIVLVLSMWLSRGVLRSLGELAAGFTRFGRGDFSVPIAVSSRDELATVAAQANAMAKSLDRLAWLEAGNVGLAEELRGELTPREVATRATRFIARYLDVPCAAFYVVGDDGVLRREGSYAAPAGTDDEHSDDEPRTFRIGEGLVGEAAREEKLRVVADPPAGYLRVRSGLGESAPRALVLVPLLHAGEVSGVLELATFEAWSELKEELVVSVREGISIALEVARARAATRALLDRLKAQEDELRATNDELQQTNEELTIQTQELVRQRRILEERNEDLAAARRGLERKAEELSTVSSYKSQFLANMSHELRTPLNSMLLLSSLLAENEQRTLTERQVEYASTIHSAGQDLLLLINQVLDLAKVEAGKQDVSIASVTLARLAEQCERVFGPLARKKGLELVVEIAGGAPAAIATDEKRAMQILNNLIGNAIKFTEHGEVRLQVGPPEGAVRFARSDLDAVDVVAFAVSDTGVGIADEHRDRIFAPFEQVDGASDRRHGGTGLGLTIARELAALLGGELRLESRPGPGSTFILFLPHDGARRVTPTPLRVDELDAIPEGEDYLLVIEDDRVLIEVLREVIHDHGLRSVAAMDGLTGLAIARARRPRGIILDVKLPDVDGWTVMRTLRSEPALARIPVHFLSAVDDARRGLAMGAVGYETKPVTRRELVRVVEAVAAKAVKPRARRVLVVEPDDDRAGWVLAPLGHAGLDVRRVTTAAAALAAAKDRSFGCIVLDLDVSDADGIELVQQLAADGAAELSIVAHTSRVLARADANRLDACGATVVVDDGGSSEDRLLDEIRLFIRRIQGSIPPAADGAPTVLSGNLRLEGRTVLLADDDMRTVYALSATLRAKGAEVLVADTGRAALDVAWKHPEVEAILMDIMMPEMDGYEATRRLREDERFRTLPIIALTAKAMKGDREKCIEAGATDYLPKPIDMDRLLSMLHSLLTKGTADRA